MCGIFVYVGPVGLGEKWSKFLNNLNLYLGLIENNLLCNVACHSYQQLDSGFSKCTP